MNITLFLAKDPSRNTGVFDYVDIAQFCTAYGFSEGDVKACLDRKRKELRGWTFKWYEYSEPDPVFTKHIFESMNQDFKKVPIMDTGMIIFSGLPRDATEEEVTFFKKVAEAQGFTPVSPVNGCMGRLDLPDKSACKVFWLTGVCTDNIGTACPISIAPRMQ